MKRNFKRHLKCATSYFLSAMTVVPAGMLCGAVETYASRSVEFTELNTHKESASDFDCFLGKCKPEERVLLAQSLGYLPKIPKEAFGHISFSKSVFLGINSVKMSLLAWDAYAEDKNDSQKTGKPIRPKTFNEVPPELVLEAEKRGFLDSKFCSLQKIKKELVWANSTWFTDPFKSENNVNYHKIVEWVAQDGDIVGKPIFSDVQIELMSTYALSEKVSERYLAKRFNDLWEKFDNVQKGEALKQLEEKTGERLTEFQRKVLIDWDNASSGDKQRVCRELNDKSQRGSVVLASSMGAGSVVLGALGVTVSAMGFAFYTTLTSVMYSVAAVFGATLPFAAYTTATTTTAVLGGPVGWCVAGGMALAIPFMFGWADEYKCASFVVQKYLIERDMRKDGRIPKEDGLHVKM